ncbi:MULTISPECIES: porin [Vibrio]|jgi:outer membrane protein OmpU|uniref:Porin n=3 Tax=Vibrio TaxID=662 RepID=A0ABX1HW88_9VIBR|nr:MULTISPECIES: porin [Vibrio]MCR9671676.1 porin [Vibrio alginolyticus]MEA3481341.1 porin [Pseudomonadota bacterium]RCW25329.1 outer membrane protein OmpU [Vibrio parahaemolyticus]GAJ74637.1 outer membrane protein OmpU [Vibrio sp. JCM 18905]ACY53915.1 outer membrane protein OmpU [Vibrio antiquarius]
MKLKTLAVAVALMASGSQVVASELYNQDGTSLEMGGRAEARLSMMDGKAKDRTRIRLNFLGKQEINENLYGVGFWEGEFETKEEGAVDNNSDLETRYAYAGLGGKYGEVTYGKNDGALFVLTDFTDIMAYHGNTAALKLPVSDRTDNMLSYKGQFEQLAVRASYRFADRTTDAKGFTDNEEDGFSLSGIYAFANTGIELGAGYADQNDSDEFMLAAAYSVGDFYFAGNYTGADVDVAGESADYKGYELAASYTMGQTVFTSTFNKGELEDADTVENLAVDVTYYFKPNFRGYASYNFDLMDNEGADEKDELALGLRYDF